MPVNRFFTVHEGRLMQVNKQTTKTRALLRTKSFMTLESHRLEQERLRRDLVQSENMINVASVPYRKTLATLRGYQRGLRMYHETEQTTNAAYREPSKFGMYNGAPLEELRTQGEITMMKLKGENYWGKKKANKLIDKGMRKGALVHADESRRRFDDLMGRMPKPRVRKTEFEELLDGLSLGKFKTSSLPMDRLSQGRFKTSSLPQIRSHTFVMAQDRQNFMSTSLPTISEAGTGRSQTFVA